MCNNPLLRLKLKTAQLTKGCDRFVESHSIGVGFSNIDQGEKPWIEIV
jgi:hypothetical protein